MSIENQKNLNQSDTAAKTGAKQPEPLEPCDKPHVAEATRTRESDEACDDGVH